MRPNPLAVLARLRGAETMAARRHLAEDLARCEAAERTALAAARALLEEGRHGGGYAAWLPRGVAQRDAAAAAARQAGLRAEQAGVALAAARAAERAVEELAGLQAATLRRAALRDAQRALDEAGARGHLTRF
ncbi:hypothetical protein [Muricoccus vinaceus]|uniref:Flagellar FliJ protein n=1 Tax=Muricoccus vinaceus TaxID=424704 RepID=A0ABV6IYH3_9PROT